LKEFKNWELFLGCLNILGIVWCISSHIETSIKPSISDIWGHSGVFEKTTNHSGLRNKFTKRSTRLVLSVPLLELSVKDRF